MTLHLTRVSTSHILTEYNHHPHPLPFPTRRSTDLANLFWKSGDRIFTPSRACDILPGIVRNQVIGLIERHSDYTIEEGEWTPDALEQADLVWVTNSLKRIQPVTAVDERRYPADHPLYHYLDQALVQTYTGSGSSNDQGNTKQNRA